VNQESSSTETANTTTNTLVRTPRESTKPDVPSVQPEDITTTTTTSSTDKSSPSPKELVALNRPPYLVDLLEAKDAYNTFDFKDQAAEIDTFIQSEMERKELDDTRENYDKVLKGLWKNIKPTDSVYTNTGQLRDYARVQQKLMTALEEKKKFEEMDPLEMSTKQLEKFLKEKDVRKY